MRKFSILLIMLGVLVVFQYCSSSKKATSSNRSAVTYAGNIQPIIQTSCSPCHIAGKGNKKSLDNFSDAKSSVDDIITRVQKNPDEKGFMPARHPKLSDSTIQLFVAWKNSGLRDK